MEESIKLFSKIIQHIRQQLNYSQAIVSEHTGVSPGTLRGLENGKVMPKLDTLKLLSNLYKCNLIETYASCLIENYEALLETYNRIEAKIALQKFDQLDNEIYQLELLQQQSSSNYFTTQIEQRIVFLTAVINKEVKRQPRRALNKLVKAIKWTTPEFSSIAYRDLYYSDLEKRLLMTIGLLDAFNEKKWYISDLLYFIYKTTTSPSILHIKACYHLALDHLKFNRYQDALQYITEGKEQARLQNELYSLSYFGLAEAKLAYQSADKDWRSQVEQVNQIRSYFGLHRVCIASDALPIFY
ncbi:helix-turn-helix domain-containing protein [Amphibacillus cookii]|uniref:helix-turn-helix domain-containing protein n=1 Tax=Amphibacillus cookii TaxID=767787 RepID=UPI0019576327|nr:transcriptional regulator with XRE-family HTH domain [Amphibacillus cookii]